MTPSVTGIAAGNGSPGVCASTPTIGSDETVMRRIMFFMVVVRKDPIIQVSLTETASETSLDLFGVCGRWRPWRPRNDRGHVSKRRRTPVRRRCRRVRKAAKGKKAYTYFFSHIQTL